ncbi:MAG: hypothetical protein HYR62_08635 [Actinobacteria bacterium]|nr:hypothetical protein [Actinomycetota bacterium]MBI3687479.1 hypothetical protein [Actinomycetota bacterium]
MRTEVFVAASDDEAKGCLYSGAAAAGVPAVHASDVTALELDLLQSVLTGEPLKRVLREPGGGILAYGGTEGPWVEGVRPTLAEALAALAPDRVPLVAGAWHAQRELTGIDLPIVERLLTELVSLAVAARDSGGQLYLRNALDATG